MTWTGSKTPIPILREALDLYEKFGTAVGAAPYASNADGSIGIKPSAMKDRLAKARAHFGVVKAQSKPKSKEAIDALAPAEAIIKASLEETLRKELKAKDSALKRVMTDFEQNRRVWEEITGIGRSKLSPPQWSIPHTTASSPGVPLALWSDWHWGEVVEPGEVGGLNAWNKEISHQRIQKLVSKTIDLCINHMVLPNYPYICVCLGGDMITGTIHEELAVTNHEYVSQTLMDLEEKLIWAIEELLKVFPKVLLPCVVGNHGRTTLKPRMKGMVFESYEYLLYKRLEAWFRKDPRVKFLIPGESDARFSINGLRILLTHGDRLGVKGGDGIIGSIGPIMRGAVKIGRAEAQVGRDFDLLMMGHWHQYLPLAPIGILVNGSMKGYDEYARLQLRAPFQLPIQALLFIHSIYGVTAQWPVFLEKTPGKETQSTDPWEVKP